MKRARIIAVVLVLCSILAVSGIGRAFSQSSNQTQQAGPKGSVGGTMIFVDPSSKKYVSDASKIVVTVVYNGNVRSIESDDQGDFDVPLPPGRYCLETAQTMSNVRLRFAPEQKRCFAIIKNKRTRLAIMLLKPA